MYINELKTRSRLFSLEPIGIGTTQCESLSSYLSRLASEHGICVSKMIGQEIAPIINKKYILNVTKEGGSGFFYNAHTINGMDVIANDFVNVLTNLTLQRNLKCLTLLNWSELLSRRGLIRKNKAWCPQCLEEWRLEGKEIYEPLVWAMQEYTNCHIHGSELQVLCPGCHKIVQVLSRKSKPGYCSNCERWLADSVIQVSKIEEQIPDFIPEMIKGSTIVVSPKSADIIQMIVSHIGNANLFSNYLGLSKSTVSSWISGQKRPMLKMLLLITFKFGLSFLDLFNSELKQISINQYLNNLSNEKDQNNRTTSYDPNWLKEQLLEYVYSNAKSISVRKLAKKLNINKRILYKKYPNLCYEISQKNKYELQSQHKKRIQVLCSEVEKIVMKLHEKGIYPSRRQVEALASKKSILREYEVKQHWKNVLTELKIN